MIKSQVRETYSESETLQLLSQTHLHSPNSLKPRQLFDSPVSQNYQVIN